MVTTETSRPVSGPARRRPRRAAPRGAARLAGAVPYFAFVGLFLVFPLAVTAVRAFQDADGAFTLEHLALLRQPQYLDAFSNSIALSLVTAGVGGAVGLVLAWALAGPQRLPWLQRAAMSFAGVASQMGGAPLAFAFIATIGTQGIVTVALRDGLGFELTEILPIGSFWALALAYLYFQIPMMAVLMLPALQGLRAEWIDSAESLGAGPVRRLVQIVGPILAPSLAGSALLLFANAFSGYAAAYAMAGSGANLVPVLIGYFLSGNVFVDANFSSALVLGMVAVMVVAAGLRHLLLRRATRWTR